jgi:hypothetical protein
MIIIRKFTNIDKFLWLTKYVVGVTANPPKNPSRPPKNGNVIAMNIVNAKNKKYINTHQRKYNVNFWITNIYITCHN